MSIKNIVFDFEQVFVRWEPFNVFKSYLKSKLEMEKLLEEINHHRISTESDKGNGSFSALLRKTAEDFPHYKDMLLDYDVRWAETMNEVPGAVDLVLDLKKAGYKIYGLSNFSSDKIKDVYEKFDFHRHLDGAIVSAFVKVVKPNIEIYKLLCDKYHIKPEETLFFDDRVENVEGAKAAGMKGFVFISPQQARQALILAGIKI
ncbi:MAG: HAD family phosphatase [Elusimicrobiota bacterium]|jgi:2-haloacid dehalogenase|nr:HAD family phosphatase [Elusimicrobiota bacterium]